MSNKYIESIRKKISYSEEYNKRDIPYRRIKTIMCPYCKNISLRQKSILKIDHCTICGKSFKV